ncbi:MAG: class I SAM-dependent methyltransferase [Candidatus Rokubacteria bacterium]|nr:class I SAM-dependent methyltransferase [Candidatus Rokubacteria bacterium]
MDPAYVSRHVEEEREHWWFRARLEILRAVLPPRAPGARRRRVVDLGCGTGTVLDALHDLGETIGVEIDDTLRGVALVRGLDVRAGALPDRVPVEPGTADVVLLLDVLEHLEDPAATLGTARELLVPHGVLVVTVPAYQWLWSSHDVTLRHKRRYTRRALIRLATDAGFLIDRATYFNTLLFPALAVVRLVGRLQGRNGHDLKRPAPIVNRLLERVFAAERHLIRRVALPFGNSILLLAHT